MNTDTAISFKRYQNKSVSWLDKELWRVFSLWIRQKYADENGVIRCVTCGDYRQWRYCDAGHYISRYHLKTKFLEVNVHPQCKRCNGKGRGEPEKMKVYIDQTYGQGTADLIEQLSRQTANWMRIDYMIKIEEYKQKLIEHGFEIK